MEQDGRSRSKGVEATASASAAAPAASRDDAPRGTDEDVRRQKLEKQRQNNRERARRWRARRKAAKLQDLQVGHDRPHCTGSAILSVGFPVVNTPLQSISASFRVTEVATVNGPELKTPIALERLERVRRKNRERARRYRARQKEKKVAQTAPVTSPNGVIKLSSHAALDNLGPLTAALAPASACQQIVPYPVSEFMEVGGERERKLEDQRAKNRERVRRWRARQKAKRLETAGGIITSMSGHGQEKFCTTFSGTQGQGEQSQHEHGLNELASVADMELVRMQQASMDTVAGHETGPTPDKALVAHQFYPDGPSSSQYYFRSQACKGDILERCVPFPLQNHPCSLEGKDGRWGPYNGSLPGSECMSDNRPADYLPNPSSLKQVPDGYVSISHRRKMARYHQLHALTRATSPTLLNTNSQMSGDLQSLTIAEGGSNENDEKRRNPEPYLDQFEFPKLPKCKGVDGIQGKYQKQGFMAQVDELMTSYSDGILPYPSCPGESRLQVHSPGADGEVLDNTDINLSGGSCVTMVSASPHMNIEVETLVSNQTTHGDDPKLFGDRGVSATACSLHTGSGRILQEGLMSSNSLPCAVSLPIQFESFHPNYA